MSGKKTNELVIEGVGTVNIGPPPEGLRPLFERKYRTAFRNYNPTGKRSIGLEDMEHLAVKTSAHLSSKEEKLEMTENMKTILKEFILCKRDSVTEAEFVSYWMSIAFGELEHKRHFALHFKPLMKISFDTVDTDKNGIIDEKEFQSWYEIRNAEASMAKKLFATLDKNGDGFISFDEWVHGFLNFIFNSVADDPITLWYGPLVD